MRRGTRAGWHGACASRLLVGGLAALSLLAPAAAHAAPTIAEGGDFSFLASGETSAGVNVAITAARTGGGVFAASTVIRDVDGFPAEHGAIRRFDDPGAMLANHEESPPTQIITDLEAGAGAEGEILYAVARDAATSVSLGVTRILASSQTRLGAFATPGPGPENLDSIRSIAITPAGDVLVQGERGGDPVVKRYGADGTYRDDLRLTQTTSAAGSWGLATDARSGDLLVVDHDSEGVHVDRYDAAGASRSRFGSASAAGGALPADDDSRIAVNPSDGAVYLSLGGSIYVFAANGGFVASLASSVLDLAVTPDGGRLWALVDDRTMRWFALGSDERPDPAPEAARASTERARITWDTETDVDLHIYDGAGNHAYYAEPNAIPESQLSSDNTAGFGPETFADRRGPGTARSFRVEACLFSGGATTVSAQIIDGDGASRTVQRSLGAAGECVELGVSRGSDAGPATNTGGGTTGPSGTPTTTQDQGAVKAIAQEQLAPPVTGKSVNVSPVRGRVTIRLPGGRRITLREGEHIPTGSVVDAKAGALRLSSTAPGGGTQSAVFSAGMFKVTQTKGTRPVTELALAEKLAPCGKAARAARKRSKKRRLWGDGTGSFRTTGLRSATTVSGTKWLVEDSCDGTLTRVSRGVVKVRDFRARKTITVSAGQHYLAR